MNQEVMQMLGALNAQHEALQEQSRIVEQQIIELKQFNEEIDVLEKQKNREIIVSIGKSVFAPMQFSGKDNFFVNVGAGYFVRKNFGETKEVINEQLKKLSELKVYLSSEMDSLSSQLESAFRQIQNS
ncbi:MAG: prefoldin subunit alpha [Nanoarchaeota archaeon]